MAESPASGQWLDCLTDGNAAASEGLLQSSMMSFHNPQQAESEMNGQPLSDKPQKELADMPLMTPNFSMFSSDSDGSEAGDVHLPNLSLGEATLEDGLHKSEAATAECSQDPYQLSVEDVMKLVRQIKLEHRYAEDAEGESDAAYYCPHKECIQVCSTETEMVNHLKDKHSNVDPSQVDDDIELELQPSKEASLSSVIAYKCTNNDCSMVCSSYEQLVEHMKSHDSGQLHRCTIHNCTETFHTLADLREHVYSHRDKRIFTCRICEESFQFSYQLRKHMELHGEDDEDEQDLEAAVKSTNLKSQADMSGNDDGTETDPGDSMIQMSSDGEGQFTCVQEDCGEVFSSKQLLKEHLAVHERLLPYKCTTCGKAFKFSFLLNRHRKMHNGLVCSQDNCHQSFKTEKELKEHMKTHDGVKKRPRGRPRKKPLENAESNQSGKMEKVTPAKPKQSPRPVGRPRKYPPQTPTTEKTEKSAEKPNSDIKPKRPRGRPRLIRPNETDKKPSPAEGNQTKAATTPPHVSYTPLSPDTPTPTRCSARSTKGQWRSSGSKTNMGGVGLLTVIKQERTKFRRLSTTDARTDLDDELSSKEQEKMPRKRHSSVEEDLESPQVKSPKKGSLMHSTSDGNETSDEVDGSENREQLASSNSARDQTDKATNPQSLDTSTPQKKVIKITSARPVVGAAPRGRPPKSVLKIGHATQEVKKSPATNVSTEKISEEAPKNVPQTEKTSPSAEGDSGLKTDNTSADLTNNQANKNKKLQRNKVSLMKTMSTRQSRGLTCVIPFCASYQLNKGHNQTSVHFIKFPQQEAEISKWIKILKLPNDFEVKPSTRICHLHFNKNDLEINSDGSWQCREGATPRIFNAK